MWQYTLHAQIHSSWTKKDQLRITDNSCNHSSLRPLAPHSLLWIEWWPHTEPSPPDSYLTHTHIGDRPIWGKGKKRLWVHELCVLWIQVQGRFITSILRRRGDKTFLIIFTMDWKLPVLQATLPQNLATTSTLQVEEELGVPWQCRILPCKRGRWWERRGRIG